MIELITDVEKLSLPCKPLEFLTETGVNRELGDKIIAELKQALEENPGIPALAAPQIGYDYRIFCIRFKDIIKTFINPIIKKKLDGIVLTAETCASFPDKEFMIARPRELEVVYYTDEYKFEDNKLLDPVAGLFDQQVQLLDGITLYDLGIPYDYDPENSLKNLFVELSAILGSEEASEDDKKEAEELYFRFIDTYKQFTNKKHAEYQATLENDELAAYRQLKFTEDVINGRTQVIVEDNSPKLNREQRRAIKFKKGLKK